jgi:phosphomannomutase
VSHRFVVIYIVRFVINYLPSGFKYIGNTALSLVEKGFEVPFGYEEAIGFMIGSEICDKDGVTAMVCTGLCSSWRRYSPF